MTQDSNLSSARSKGKKFKEIGSVTYRSEVGYSWLRQSSDKCQTIAGSFPFVPPPPPSLVGAYYLQPPDARAIFLHNDLLCNDT